MSLILVDAPALVYRAYYAFVNRPLTGPGGEPTSVVFGFLNSVLRLIEAYRPTHLALAFDVRGPTFRHEIYPEYKAHRKPMPDELAAQLPRLHEVLAGWGVGRLELPGWEADDVIGTVARRSRGVTDRAWLYSGDKDFLQLLDERTGMLKPGRRGDEITPLGPQDVRRQYGLEPRELPDVFALSGDASDNIPGCPGIGEKTAAKLVREFGSLDALLADLQSPDLTPRLRRLLAEHREQVLLSRRLFVIDREAPLQLDWEALRTRLPTGPEVVRLLGRLGLRTLLELTERVEAAGGAPAPDAVAAAAGGGAPAGAGETDGESDGEAGGETDGEAGEEAAATGGAARGATAPPDADASELARRGYVICIDDKDLREYLQKLPEGAPLAVDTETDGLRPDACRLVGISLAAAGRPAAYIPVLRRDGTAAGEGDAADLFGAGDGERSALEALRPLLAPVLADPRRPKIGQNLKFDEWVLTRHGMPLAGPRFDTMVAAWLLEPDRQRHGLGELAAEHLGERVIPYDALFARGDRKRDILDVPLPRLAVYAAEDADVAFRLHEVLADRLAAAGLDGLFRDVEMPLSRVLFRMERRGIRIDVPFLRELRRRFAAEMEALQARILEAAGCEFNLQSPRQLAEVLFERLGLKPLKRTATGWSTDVTVLTALADRHPLPGLILEHRQLAKLQGTYVEALGGLVDPATGLVHTSFNQAVAATGRLSSSDPNLQNIPIRTELGRQIRRAFVPRRPGNVLLSADYSQIELRLLAHLSGDEELRRVFREGGDVHRRTAALIAGCSEDEVTSRMRRDAKTINFGVIYGMGARALAKQIHVGMGEARRFIDAYFDTYPGVRRFIDEAKDEARRRGYVETLLGRRRPVPDILSGQGRIRSFQERVAVNTPIQGTAADLIKVAMIGLDAELEERGLGAMLLLQVHDELVLEVPEAELDEAGDAVRRRMETVMELSVPLTVDVHVGRNWAEAHD